MTRRAHPRPFRHCSACKRLAIVTADSPDACDRCGAPNPAVETLDVRLIDCLLCTACRADLPASGQPFNVFLETGLTKNQVCSHCQNQRGAWPDLKPISLYAVARWQNHGLQAYQIIARR